MSSDSPFERGPNESRPRRPPYFSLTYLHLTI